MSENKQHEILLPEEIRIVSGYGKNRITFYLRMITMAEEAQYIARHAALADTPDREDKEYAVLVDALVAWSTKLPTLSIPGGEDTSEVPLVEDVSSPEDAIRKFFEGYSIAKSRIANAVVLEYRMAMMPTTSFL